jgi:hypothetical protein
MAQLNNATGANIANQAALMAGQRGASANPAAIARQAAMQGAATQQQAVGQGAALQAQQSLNALGQAGNLANTEANQLQQAQNIYGNQALQGQANLLGNINNQNQLIAQQYAARDQMQGNVLSGLTGAAGTALGTMFGGPIGGVVAGNLTKNMTGPKPTTMMAAEGGKVGPKSSYCVAMAHGGKVPALVSPGEQYLPPKAAEEVAKGKKKPFQAGERIPGTPKVPGNSYANDTVPKTLQEGGVVIPNSIMQSKNAEKKAAEFVRAVLAKNKQIPSK